jgi:prevent-host-death family protein
VPETAKRHGGLGGYFHLATSMEMPMASYSIAKAQGKLFELVDAANAAETVTLTRSGKPVTMLMPLEEASRMTPEMFDRLAALRHKWSPLNKSAATAIASCEMIFREFSSPTYLPRSSVWNYLFWRPACNIVRACKKTPKVPPASLMPMNFASSATVWRCLMKQRRAS